MMEAPHRSDTLRIHSVWLTVVAVLLLSACSREPRDPFEAYLWQFEQLTAEMFEHFDKAHKVVRLDAAAATDVGLYTEDVDVYRFMLIPPAAKKVITHLAFPPRSMVLALDDGSVDPDWALRFSNAIENARTTLDKRIASFKARMPEDSINPDQDGPLGELMFGQCKRGGIYSYSDGCKIGRYAFDDNGSLFFYVQHNRKLQQLMIEEILDIDAADWIEKLKATSRFEATWYCDSRYHNEESGERKEWFSNLTVYRTDDDRLRWRDRTYHNGQWFNDEGGGVRIESSSMFIFDDRNTGEVEYQYTTDRLAEGQLARDSSRQGITSTSTCCPDRSCAEY